MFTYLACFLLMGLLHIRGMAAFNLDTRTVKVYSYPGQTSPSNNVFFGFTVSLYSYHKRRWLLVGAPLSDVMSQDGTVLPKYGALYKCETTAGPNECVNVNVDNKPERKGFYPSGSSNEVTMETKSGQWLGATLRSTNGTILVCAPRYSHKTNVTKIKKPFVNSVYLRPWLSGGCYVLDSNLDVLQDNGVLKPQSNSANPYQANSQVGFSADLADHQSVVMGKPGASIQPTPADYTARHWSGGIDFYSMLTSSYKSTTRTKLDKNDYMGYDVVSGFFTDKSNKDIAGGAPRGNNMKGKVLIYGTQDKDDIVFKSQLEIPEDVQKAKNTRNFFSSYFGSKLCAVDLNKDGFTDLLVGAPLYTDNKDEGRVYVYINKNGILTLLRDTVLKGDNTPGSRFGASIANVGDLNRDGYQDVMIGAPYEGHNDSGAVYVYYGTKNGIEHKYRQKITGGSINKTMKGFGYSISGAVDIDDNGYPDVAVGSYWSNHAVIFKTRRIVEIEAFIKPDRTRIVLENKDNTCKIKDGTLHKCLNVTVCFKFRDREPSNRQDLKVDFLMEADRDIARRDFRRMYFYNGKDRSFTVDGEITLPQQHKEYCLHPYTVYISEKILVLDLLKELTFDLRFGLADKSCQLVPDVPCPVIDDYQPTSIRNDQVLFQKQCSGEVCKPNLSITGHVRLPGNQTVLLVGTTDILSVDVDIENKAKDASYQTVLTLYYPKNLSYIGPTSTKNVLCKSNTGNASFATCLVGNPFKARSKKSLSISFSTQDITTDFMLLVKIASANNDTDDSDNIVHLSVTTKYLTDMEIIGTSQPEEVIYQNKASGKAEVKRANDIGPRVIQTITILNHGPSFVEDALVRIQVPKLNNKDDTGSWLLYLLDVELSGGPGVCKARTNPLSIPTAGENSTEITSNQKVKSIEPSEITSNQGCFSAVCEIVECRLGTFPKGREIKISMTSQLWQNTFIKMKPSTSLITTAQLIVPKQIMQTDTSNDFVKINLTVRPSIEGNLTEEISWWIILLSVLGGLLLLALLIAIMYKLGFFRRSVPQKDAPGPEEAKPMKV